MFSFKQQWCFGEQQLPIDDKLFKLLAAVENTLSLKQAADKLELSYRHAWGLIKKHEALFSQSLVTMHRGRTANSQLTVFARQLLQQYTDTEESLQQPLRELAKKTNQILGLNSAEQAQTISCYASHDLVISRLIEHWNAAQEPHITLETHGSLDGLRHFAEGHCQMVGFHFPQSLPGKQHLADMKEYLAARPCHLLPLVTRTQGLLLRKGNPKKIRQLKDLTKRSVRFINRQRDSGTRMLLERLLQQEGIDPDCIQGFQHEEFTHSAIAALIASGMADAGLGIQAMGAAFDLEFVPLVREQYLLAIADSIKGNTQQQINELIQSTEIRAYIDTLAGYAPLSETHL